MLELEKKQSTTTTIDDLPRGRGFPSAAGRETGGEEKEGDAAAAAAAGTRKAQKTRQKTTVCVLQEQHRTAKTLCALIPRP